MASAIPTTQSGDRTVITGMGIACPWGIGPAADVMSAPMHAAPDRSDDGAWRIPDSVLAPDAKRVTDLGGDRACLLAIPAIRHALEQADCDLQGIEPTGVGLVLGSAFAALADMLQFAAEVKDQTPRFVSPIHFPQTVGNYAAGALARAFKINGPNLTFGHGPQAGLRAIAEAARLIQAGWAELILAGGTDAISANLLSAMVDAEQVKPDGPFAAQPAEGACFVAIEPESRARARGAKILAAIRPDERCGERVALSIHLTGDPKQDRRETDSVRAEASLTQDPLAILSSRHLMGNAFAASAAAQFALAVLAVQHRPIPVWRAERTHETVRLARDDATVHGTRFALAASNPDPAGERVLLGVEAP